MAAGGWCPGMTGSVGGLCFEPMSQAPRFISIVARRTSLLEDGEWQGAAIWHRILDAIERLQAQKPAEGEPVH